jgi:pyruvate kinase
MVQGLVRAGASVFRINFSHGTADDHARMVALVRQAETEIGRPLAVLVDLPGPKVRLGPLEGDALVIKPGQAFELRPDGGGDARGAATTYPGLAGDLRVGDRVLLADGAVELAVEEVAGDAVLTRCVSGGSARSGQGVNVPAERLGLPAVTSRDREGLVALSRSVRTWSPSRSFAHPTTCGSFARSWGTTPFRSSRRSRRDPRWRTSRGSWSRRTRS